MPDRLGISDKSHGKDHQHHAKLGPLVDAAGVTEFVEEQTWVVIMDDETTIVAELDEDRGMLVLSSEVGSVGQDIAEDFETLLLQYNLQWKTTGGIAMALDQKGGTLFQTSSVSFADLEVSRLTLIVRSFVAKVFTWRTVLAGRTAQIVSNDQSQEQMIRI